MTKIQALEIICLIQKGKGIPKRNSFPKKMKSLIAEKNWYDGRFSLGMEYGYILGLIHSFKIKYKDIK